MDALEGIQVLRSRHNHSLRVGFTGTRTGMSIDQMETLELLMKELSQDRNVVWHDGDCVGADEQAHGIAHVVCKEVQMIGHPCNLTKFRAYMEYDEEKDELPPLVRNKKIVEQSDIMFATPAQHAEITVGSGTWATIRHARRVKKPLIIIWPEGNTTLENM